MLWLSVNSNSNNNNNHHHHHHLMEPTTSSYIHHHKKSSSNSNKKEQVLLWFKKHSHYVYGVSAIVSFGHHATFVSYTEFGFTSFLLYSSLICRVQGFLSPLLFLFLSFMPSPTAEFHRFKYKNFHGLVYCDYCEKLLWGLARQGVQCSGKSHLALVSR